MSAIRTRAIILRTVNYRENDRMATLFSPEIGKIDAAIRGCRKPKSALLAASEIFVEGEFTLYVSKGRYSVTGCTVYDSYYDLRFSLDRLTYATYLLNLCEEAAQRDEPDMPLYQALLTALSYLAYSKEPCRSVFAWFLLRFSDVLGYHPYFDSCVSCGKKPDSETVVFDAQTGGVMCEGCSRQVNYKVFSARSRTVDWMRASIKETERPDRFLPYESHAGEAIAVMMPYISLRMDRQFKSSKILAKMEAEVNKQPTN